MCEILKSRFRNRSRDLKIARRQTHVALCIMFQITVKPLIFAMSVFAKTCFKKRLEFSKKAHIWNVTSKLYHINVSVR